MCMGLFTYSYCIKLIVQNKTIELEYAYGFAYCLSAKLMKEMEPYFRFDSKICHYEQVHAFDVHVHTLFVLIR